MMTMTTLTTALDTMFAQWQADILKAAEVASFRKAKLGAAPARGFISVAAKDGSRLYLSGVSFKPGDGFKVSRIRYTANRDQAMEFRAVASDGIARHLCDCGYAPRFEVK